MASQVKAAAAGQATNPYLFKSQEESILSKSLNGLQKVINGVPQHQRKTATETITGRVQAALNTPQTNKVVPIADQTLVEPSREQKKIYEATQNAQKDLIPLKDAVEVKFDEKNFSNITENLSKLFKSLDNLEGEVNQKISDISGITAILVKEAIDYEQQKSKGIQHLKHYSSFFNNAVDIIQTIITRETQISKLKELSTTTIDNFIETNNKRVAFFSSLFSDIVTQHQQLKETAETGGSYKTTKLGLGSSMIGGLFGSTPNVKQPNAHDPSFRYAKETSHQEISTALDQTLISHNQKKAFSEAEFSVLFQDNNEFLNTTLTFSKAARKHLGAVVQTKHTLIPTDPEFDQRKIEATELPKKYENLHDQCQKAYEKFHEYNKENMALKLKLQTHLDAKLKDLQVKKDHLITLFGSYAASSKALDQKIHNKSELTKDIRILTADTSSDKKYSL